MSRDRSVELRVLVVDNYDSFTWNLVQLLDSLGATCMVHRSDALAVDAALALAPDAIVLSPGPFGPERAGICAELVRRASVPVLGVCLGMQVIAVVGGARVVPSGRPVHGRQRDILHAGAGLFRGLPSPLRAGLYHSLVVDPDSVGRGLTITARSETGEIMGCRLDCRPVEGVLFHPESFLTVLGDRLLENFLERSAVRRLGAHRVS